MIIKNASLHYSGYGPDLDVNVICCAILMIVFVKTQLYFEFCLKNIIYSFCAFHISWYTKTGFVNVEILK